MQSLIFAVNDEPYCLWERDPVARTRNFLNGIDVDFFDYTLQTHLSAEDQKRSLVAIKFSLHHSIEALFSLLGALVQAHDCPYAWIAKCSNEELRKFAIRVDRNDPTTISKLNISTVNWHSIASVIFHYYRPDTELQANTINCFAKLWSSLTREFTNPIYIDEYNALKHGFRVRSTGFTLRVGLEHEYGVPPPESEMHTIGHSDFGATFLKIEQLGAKKSRQIRSRETSINWSEKKTILLHQLVQNSINNVVSALKILNGFPPSECKFLRPEDDVTFDEPWEHSTGVTTMNFDHIIDENELPDVTKKQLLDLLRKRE